MKTLLIASVLASGAPFLPGEVITYEHGEGLVAGDAELNDNGYWMTEYSFGPIGQSPVDDERASIVRDMLAGKRLRQPIRNNICRDQLCTEVTTYKIKWRSECAVRDLYSYRNMDAVRVEWECDGKNDGFNIIDFEDGTAVGVRDFGPDKTIWIKDPR